MIPATGAFTCKSLAAFVSFKPSVAPVGSIAPGALEPVMVKWKISSVDVESLVAEILLEEFVVVGIESSAVPVGSVAPGNLEPVTVKSEGSSEGLVVIGVAAETSCQIHSQVRTIITRSAMAPFPLYVLASFIGNISYLGPWLDYQLHSLSSAWPMAKRKT